MLRQEGGGRAAPRRAAMASRRRRSNQVDAAGITSIDSSGAVIMPPIIGAAMRCMTSLPAPAPQHDRQQAGDDHGDRHGLGSDAQDRALADGIEQRPLIGGAPSACRAAQA